jgi:Rrf2 family nitric oxide-sensitive transcriptional repressor
MRLTAYTDYALQVLMYLGAHPGEIVTTRHVATAQGISLNHLTKIVHQLGQNGVLDTVRGRAGGIRLATSPDRIMVGAVVRMTEPDFDVVACLAGSDSNCRFAPDCKLKGMLAEATRAYLARLDSVPLSALLPGAAPGRFKGKAAAA